MNKPRISNEYYLNISLHLNPFITETQMVLLSRKELMFEFNNHALYSVDDVGSFNRITDFTSLFTRKVSRTEN